MLFIGFTLAYFLLFPVFVLMWIILMIYIVMKTAYPRIRREMTPVGKRINHRMLKGYMKEKYGDEGNGIYKEFVRNLRRRGYY